MIISHYHQRKFVWHVYLNFGCERAYRIGFHVADALAAMTGIWVVYGVTQSIFPFIPAKEKIMNRLISLRLSGSGQSRGRYRIYRQLQSLKQEQMYKIEFHKNPSSRFSVQARTKSQTNCGLSSDNRLSKIWLRAVNSPRQIIIHSEMVSQSWIFQYTWQLP